MNKSILIAAALALFMGGCGALETTAPSLLLAAPSPLATPSAGPTPTGTLEPTPTLDYSATVQAAETSVAAAQWDALHAQETSVAANLGLVMVTAEHERDEMLRLGWTATRAAETSIAQDATNTALPTWLPPTQTAQVLDRAVNVYVAGVEAGQLTATHEAPTQVVAMAQAQAEADMAPVREFAQASLAFAGAVFMLALVGLIVWAMRQPHKAQPEDKPTERPLPPINSYRAPAEPEAAPVVIEPMETDEYAIVPCSPDDLDALAMGWRSVGLAVNQWDGTKRPSPLTSSNKKETILRMRNFMRDPMRGLAAENPNTKQLGVTRKGEIFFDSWLRDGSLPHQWRFAPEEAVSSGNSVHAHENHAHENEEGAVGEVVGEIADGEIETEWSL